MTIKITAIKQILDKEGGYVYDPLDSGGETNFGITKKVAVRNGYIEDMIDMPEHVATDIYGKRYWDSMRLDEISEINQSLAIKLFDAGVNVGISRSSKWLQMSLNVLNNRGRLFNDIAADGKVGKNTLKALRSFYAHRKSSGISVLLKMINSLQGAFYIELAERREKDERFLYGWFSNRIY